jgi:DNA adenine methylase
MIKSMATKNKSPLRYPGGKTRAVATLERYVTTYFPGRRTLLSPFFGGGSFEIALQEKGYTVYGNDLFAPLYTFWKVVKERPKELATRVLECMPIDKEMFKDFRAGILEMTDEMEIAVAYYIINRCSFSGSTFCGGFSEESSTGRLNESSIRTLATTRLGKTTFSNSDCCAFLTAHPETSQTIVYADPPYYISTYIYGRDGDLHAGFDHEAFAAAIKKRKDWVISYNDCDYIRKLYAGCRFFSESWSYGMNASKKSSEIIILPCE